MRVIVTAATTGEWMPAAKGINLLYTAGSKQFNVHFHQSGIGCLSTAVSLTKLVLSEKPDLIIQVGIAGTYSTSLPLGNVVVVGEEYLGDLGVEESGKWHDIFDMNLAQPNNGPFKKKALPNPGVINLNLLSLPVVRGVTVNEITTNSARIEQLIHQYKPITESMEGAALHYVGLVTETPFLQMRAISNLVGVRDKQQWKLQESIKSLNEALLRYLDELYRNNDAAMR